MILFYPLKVGLLDDGKTSFRTPWERSGLSIPEEMQFLALFISITALATKINAAPATLQGRSVTPLSASELNSLAPFTQFARAAYCPTNVLQSWSCGRVFFPALCTTKMLTIVVNC